ncbi:MAG: YkgJ family cysteine cluster protein [Spirochaetaceae bacterium]|nr:YkgJ family cysteine cluster protein [Spirochaetaceae bacterium]MBP5793289.1 YkgJ family cysteine cluster protein [Spirochaetaceae bacterium]
MTQIPTILQQLQGTSAYSTLVNIENAYRRIGEEQNIWYEKTHFLCPNGCGSCCMGFEPDLFEGEAMYMAAWLLENRYETAVKITHSEFPFNNGKKTCPLFDEDSAFHCSAYHGRPFVCRLFGASSFRGKNGGKLWRPCKFYPEEKLSAYKPPLEKRSYSESETINAIGAIPPLMCDLTENAFSADSTAQTTLLRRILPDMINKLLWLISMNDNDTPNGTPSSPIAA